MLGGPYRYLGVAIYVPRVRSTQVSVGKVHWLKHETSKPRVKGGKSEKQIILEFVNQKSFYYQPLKTCPVLKPSKIKPATFASIN